MAKSCTVILFYMFSQLFSKCSNIRLLFCNCDTVSIIIARLLFSIVTKLLRYREWVTYQFSYTMGYSRKKPKRGGWGHTFLNPPGIFHFFYFSPGNFRQNKAPPLEIPQNCVTFLGNSNTKNQDPWKFHIIFFWSILEIPLHF